MKAKSDLHNILEYIQTKDGKNGTTLVKVEIVCDFVEQSKVMAVASKDRINLSNFYCPNCGECFSIEL